MENKSHTVPIEDMSDAHTASNTTSNTINNLDVGIDMQNISSDIKSDSKSIKDLENPSSGNLNNLESGQPQSNFNSDSSKHDHSHGRDSAGVVQMDVKAKSAILIGLILAVFLGSLDGTIVATAVPVIASEFNAFAQLTWIITAYFITFNAFQPLYGKFSDIFGRRAAMLFAVITFIVGSAGCGAAPTFWTLVAFRAIAGIGAAGLIGLTFIIIADIIPLQERPKYQSLVIVAFGVSSVIGPLLGGAFTEHVSWRWCFYINIPIGAITVAAVALYLNLPRKESNLIDDIKRVDFLGATVMIAAVVCILLATNWGGSTYPWNDGRIIALYVVGAVLIIGFILIEMYIAKEPILPMRLFRNRNLVGAWLVIFFQGMAFFGFIFYLPIWFQVVEGSTPLIAGVQLLPMLLGVVIFSITSGFIVFGIQKLLPPKIPAYLALIHGGNLILVLGVILITTWTEHTLKGVEVIYMLILGIGLGLCIQMCIFAAQASVAFEDLAVATSLATFFQTIGGSIGIAIFGSLQNNYLINHFSKIDPSVVAPEILGQVLQSTEFLYSSAVTLDQRALIVNIYVQSLILVFRIAIGFSLACLLAGFIIKPKPMPTMTHNEPAL